MLAIMERQDLLIALEFVEIEERIARLTVLVQELRAKGEQHGAIEPTVRLGNCISVARPT
jgi:hypothetical protein